MENFSDINCNVILSGSVFGAMMEIKKHKKQVLNVLLLAYSSSFASLLFSSLINFTILFTYLVLLSIFTFSVKLNESIEESVRQSNTYERVVYGVCLL